MRIEASILDSKNIFQTGRFQDQLAITEFVTVNSKRFRAVELGRFILVDLHTQLAKL